MFFVDKYTPKTINEAKFHKNLLHRLQNISKNESIPHVMLCGPDGCGKKTITKMFLEMLFDKDVHKTEDVLYSVYGSGNKPRDVTVKQSNYHIVIEPENNNFDRYLIQDIVKEYAKRIPMNIFRTKKIFKIVLINNADNLSKHAQTSLRRTMEKYSKTCRFILWCNSPTKIIDPLISRCIFFTINAPTDDELFEYLFEISIKEKMKLSVCDFSYIINSARGNIKEALWLLQLYKFGYGKKNVYYQTIDLIVAMIIAHDIEYINNPVKTNKSVENAKICKTDKLSKSNQDKPEKKEKMYIRDLIYNIMITNINGARILKDITNKLLDNNDIPDECKYEIIHIISYYEHNLIRGRRFIIHLEAMIVRIMGVLFRYKKNNPEYINIFNKYVLPGNTTC